MSSARRCAGNLNPGQEGAGVEAKGTEGHKKQTVQFKAITAACSVHHFVEKHCGLKRDTTSQKNVEVFKWDREVLSAMQSFKPILCGLHGPGIVQALKVNVKFEGFNVHSTTFLD
jgi:hypothetical protein